jgi:hypothetical protein
LTEEKQETKNKQQLTNINRKNAICYVYRRLIESPGVYETLMELVRQSQTKRTPEKCGYDPEWGEPG